MSDKPTEIQKRVLQYIRRHWLIHSYSPSFQDVADELRFDSKGVAQYHLVKLRDLGLITWNENTARSIRILASAGTEASAGKLENQKGLAADAN